MTTEEETQLGRIGTGLEALASFLEDPLAASLLQVDTLAEAANRKKELRRLRTTLGQYQNRSRRLVYIAFMGHFSAGKSSSINALLQLDGADGAREIGWNPTDTAITLLTHPKNMNDLLGLHRETGLPVRAVPVEHPLLESVVLADTPGSGDPNVADELTKDFLAVCDCLFYFISATNPIDNADLPLLQMKQERLPQQSMRFVITRADEFRRVREERVTESNFDQGVADGFLGRLAARLDALMPGQGLVADPRNRFLFLDNKDSFRVGAFLEAVRAEADLEDIDRRVAIHDHKVAYFRRAACEIRDYFERSLKTRSRDLAAFIESARENVSRYERSAQVASNTLTERWVRAHERVGRLETREREAIPDATLDEDLPGRVWDAPKLVEWKTDLHKSLDRASKDQAASLVRSVLQTVENHHRNALVLLEERLRGVQFDDQGEGLVEAAFAGQPNYLDQAVQEPARFGPTLVLYKLERSFKTYREHLQGVLDQLESLAAAMRGWVDNRSILTELADLIGRAESDLATDIEALFERVEVYRSGVFAMQSKQQIQKLGIGQQLDTLERGFDDAERTATSNRATSELFADHGELVEAHEAVRADLVRRLDAASAKIASTRKVLKGIKQPPLTIQDATVTGVEEARVQVIDRLRRSMTAEWSALGGRIATAWGTSRSTLQESRAVVLKAWKRRTLGVGAVVAVVVGSGLAWLVFPGLDLGSSVWADIGANIAADLLVFVAATAGIRKLRTPTRRTSELASEAVEGFRVGIRDAIQSAFPAMKEEAHHRDGAKTALLKNWREAADQDLVTIAGSCEGIVEDLRRLTVELDEVRALMEESLVALSSGFAAYFADADGNIAKLEALAGDLRDRAITPSFRFIQENGERLQALEAQVAEIRF